LPGAHRRRRAAGAWTARRRLRRAGLAGAAGRAPPRQRPQPARSARSARRRSRAALRAGLNPARLARSGAGSAARGRLQGRSGPARTERLQRAGLRALSWRQPTLTARSRQGAGARRWRPCGAEAAASGRLREHGLPAGRAGAAPCSRLPRARAARVLPALPPCPPECVRCACVRPAGVRVRVRVCAGAHVRGAGVRTCAAALPTAAGPQRVHGP